jgi:PAS domain S-box-containing protein
VDDIQKLVHLLQVHQIELEHQNQELRLAQEELELSRNQYVNLFDFSPLPYFALNIDGVIKEVNLSGAKMLGTDRNRLVGKQLVSFIMPGEREIFNSFVASNFKTQVKGTCELRVFNKDKRTYNVRLEGQTFEDPMQSDQRCLVAIINLTEFKNQSSC